MEHLKGNRTKHKNTQIVHPIDTRQITYMMAQHWYCLFLS